MDSDVKQIIEAAGERLEIIAELQKTQGWQLFQAVLDQDLKAAQYHLDKAKDPSEAWKELWVLKTLQSLKSWSDREIQTSKEVIADAKRK